MDNTKYAFVDESGAFGYDFSDPGCATHLIISAIIVDEKNYCVESTLGFDVGVFDENGYCYSSIYQEILNSNVNIFQQFYNQLNENLLFPDYYTALAFLQYHKAKEEEGFDVEWTKILRIYRINNVLD